MLKRNLLIPAAMRRISLAADIRISAWKSAGIALAVFCLVCLAPGLALCCTGPAQPGTVVFYPDEAQLSVEEEQEAISLPTGGRAFVVSLPAGALRDSFMLSIGDTPASGYYWPEKEEKEAILNSCGKHPVPNFANLPDNETSAERRALLEKVLPLAEEAARTEGELRSIQTRLDLLQKSFDSYGAESGKNISRANEAATLSNLYQEEYPKLQKELRLSQRGLADVRALLAKAEKALVDFDRLHGGDVVVVPFDGQGRQKLHYAYVLPAGCSISYRLDARPDKGEFSVNQDVALRQDSGLTWKNADLYISTVRRDKTLKPVNIRPWEIRMISRPKPDEPRLAQESMVMMDAEPLPVAAPMAGEGYVAKQRVRAQVNFLQERGTYRLWSLGRRDIAFGTPVNLSLASDTYAAKFRYTLRPISSPKGFLTAEVDLPKSLELPPGMAQFSVDGAVMGRQIFSFDGNKGSIFFGSDPQVTAIMRDLKQTSGEQGFFSKEQTRSWHWEITLKSTRPNPVDVTLEDPAPVSKDEAINLITQSRPRPEEIVNEPKDGGARIYQWKLTLNPGEPMVVDHQIQLVAPVLPDREVSPGR